MTVPPRRVRSPAAPSPGWLARAGARSSTASTASARRAAVGPRGGPQDRPGPHGHARDAGTRRRGWAVGGGVALAPHVRSAARGVAPTHGWARLSTDRHGRARRLLAHVAGRGATTPRAPRLTAPTQGRVPRDPQPSPRPACTAGVPRCPAVHPAAGPGAHRQDRAPRRLGAAPPRPGGARAHRPVIAPDQGHSGAAMTGRDGCHARIAAVGRGPAGAVRRLAVSRLARAGRDGSRRRAIGALPETLVRDAAGGSAPGPSKDRRRLGCQGPMRAARSSRPQTDRAAVVPPPGGGALPPASAGSTPMRPSRTPCGAASPGVRRGARPGPWSRRAPRTTAACRLGSGASATRGRGSGRRGATAGGWRDATTPPRPAPTSPAAPRPDPARGPAQPRGARGAPAGARRLRPVRPAPGRP
jgi:hypothetical protein